MFDVSFTALALLLSLSSGVRSQTCQPVSLQMCNSAYEGEQGAKSYQGFGKRINDSLESKKKLFVTMWSEPSFTDSA